MGPKVWRPKELGAFRSSHHALTLKRLQGLGYVERIPLASKNIGEVRVNFGYRITEAGKAIWCFLKEMAQLPVHTVFGGVAARERVELLAQIAMVR